MEPFRKSGFRKNLKSLLVLPFSIVLNSACTTGGFYKTVDQIDFPRFMTKWYVIAGRFTSFEEGAHNAIETYTWNEKENRIDIDFQFRKDSFDGELKKMPQKAWIHNESSRTHWKVQPFWPLKFDYLVIALDPNYEWTVIGVPNQKYLWIMATRPQLSEETLSKIIQHLETIGYSTKDLVRVPQKW